MSGEAKPRAPGRPTKWRPAYIEQARRLAAIGLIEDEMAQFFGIGTVTLYRWKQRHPEFAAALAIGKEAADARVEQALYHRAIGYAHEAVKIHTLGGEVMRTSYTERYPPDVSAAMFWLKNRRPDLWRDRSELTVSSDLAQRIAAGRARLIAEQGATIEGERADLSPPFQGGVGDGCGRSELTTPAENAPPRASSPRLRHPPLAPPLQGGEEEE